MARWRFENPKPFQEGNYWWIKIRQEDFRDGKLRRIQKRLKVAPVTTGARVAQWMDSEIRPLNQT